MYISCGNEDGNPWLTEHGGSYTSTNEMKRWGYFKDDVCFMEYNKGYGMSGAFAIGYCISGLIILHFGFEKKTKLTKQMEWHHLILISGFVAGLIAGYGYPGNMCCVMLSEISSIFLNIKEMFPKDCRTTCLGQTNQLAFFLTFTVFRMITFPFLVMRCGIIMVTTFHVVSPIRKFFLVFAFVQALNILFLNLFWYVLVLKGLKRGLQELGLIPSCDGRMAYKDLDEIEAHQLETEERAFEKMERAQEKFEVVEIA